MEEMMEKFTGGPRREPRQLLSGPLIATLILRIALFLNLAGTAGHRGSEDA
jgi:hypothetical protein